MAEKSRIAIMSVKSSHALGMAAYLRKKSQARVELLSTQERVESLIKGQANPPCILLIDSNVLPELDSSISLPQILSHIKQNCPIATVVVFATPDVLSARLALRRAGATHLLPFPIDREEVYTIVQQALGQRRSLQALEKAAHTVVLAAEQRARTLRAIHEVAASINSALDLTEVRQRTCRAAVEMFGVDHSGMVEFDESYISGRVVAEYPQQNVRNTLIPLRGIPAEERLISHHQPIVISEITPALEKDLGGVIQIFQQFKIQSILIVPIISEGRVVGSFSLDTIGRRHEFTVDEIESCEVLAAQVAVTIEKTRLLHKTKRHATQLEALRTSSLALTSELDLDRLFQKITAAAVNLLGARSSGIYEYQRSRDILTLVADYNHSLQLPGQLIQRGEGMAGRILDQKLPVLAVADYPNWDGRAAAYRENCPFDSVIAVPITWQKQFKGVLYVDSDAGRIYSADDSYSLQLLADHAAIALNNAHLMAEQSHYHDQLAHLAEASPHIMGHLDGMSQQERLNVIARTAAYLLRAETSRVFLLIPGHPERLQRTAFYPPSSPDASLPDIFAIDSFPGGGLTSYIAARQSIFRAHGSQLRRHPAIRHKAKEAERCQAMLSIPLFERRDGQQTYMGMLRVDNKCDSKGHVLPDTPFSDSDERLLSILGDAAVAAIANATLVDQRTDQSQHWQRLVTHAPIGIIINDRSGLITTVNEYAAQILSSSIHELQGRRVEQLFANDHEANSIGRELHATQSVIHREVKLRRDDGMTIPVRLAVTQLFNSQNEPRDSIGFFEDLRSIQNATKRLRLLLDINTLIAHATALRPTLSQLAERLVDLLEVTCCRIVLLDDTNTPTDILIIHSVQRGDQRFSRLPQQISPLTASYWPYPLDIERAGPFILQNSELTHQFSLKILSLSCGVQPPFQSAMIVPLHGQQRIVGALELGEQRHWSRAQVAESDQDILHTIATEIAGMIERVQMAELMEYQNQRFSLLDGAVRSLRSEQTITQFYQQFVRLSVTLFNGTSGALFVYYAHRGMLIVEALHGFPNAALGQRFDHSENVIGQIAQSGKSLTITEEAADKLGLEVIDVRHLFCAVVVPLITAGDVRAVLLVGDTSQAHPQIHVDSELVRRFTLQAALGIQTVQMLDKEHRVFQLLNLLQGLNDFLQTSTDLNDMYRALLTAVTSGDGLRLNRAVVCILSQDGALLQGTDGVGHFIAQEAFDAWLSVLNDRRDAIRSLIDNLHDGSLLDTPLAASIRQFSMHVGPGQHDAICEAIHEKQGLILHQEGTSWEGRLSPEFLKYYQPAPTIVIAPLISRTRVLGVIVADNKFNHAEISDEDCEKLMTFARTAALVIENSILLKQSETAHQLASAFLAARPPENPHHPDDILREAIHCVKETMHAMWVSMFLINDLGEPQRLISTKVSMINRTRLLRENGISQTVMRTGEPEIFEDTAMHLHRLHPSIERKNVKAAICLPFKRRDQCRGVVWIHFDQPRQFGPGEIEALQLFFQRIAVLHEDAQRLHVLEEIHAAAQAVALASGVESVTQTIAAHARALTQADVAILWSYSAQEKRFLPAKSVKDGLSDTQWGRIKKFCPDTYDVLASTMSGDHIYAADLLDHPELLADRNMQQLAQAIGAHSVQILGLHVAKESLGVLLLAYRQPRSFYEDDIRASGIFAHFAALTLRQAYYQNAAADLARNEKEAMNTIRTIVRASTLESANNALQQIVESIRSLLKCDTVVLYTYEPQRKQLYSREPVTLGIRNPNSVARIEQRLLRASLVSELIHNPQPVLIDNVSQYPRFAQSYFVMMEDIVSTAAFPLTFGTTILGVVFVGYRQSHHFLPHDQEMLQLLADQAAITIRNDQLLEEKKYTIDMLSRLQVAGTIVTNTQSAQHDQQTRHEITLLHILNQMLEIINAKAKPKCSGHIALIYRHTLCYALAYPPEQLKQLEESESYPTTAAWITRHALQKKRLVHLSENHNHPEHVSASLHMRSGIAVPVKNGERVIAVLTLAHPDEAAFGADDEQALQTLASYAAIAIQNARLIDRLKLMTEISETATRSAVPSDDEQEHDQLSEPLSLLHNVCARLEEGHVLGKPSGRTRATIWLYNATDNNLIFKVAKNSHLRLRSIDDTETSSYCIAMGEGICGWVAQKRQRSNVGDIRISTAPPYYRRVLPKRIETRSELCVPICYGKGSEQELIGVLDLQSESSYAFDDEDEQHLELLASQLAIIIRKAQDYQELRTVRNMIAARTALVWISMITDYWRHRIDQNANNIVHAVGYIRRFFTEQLPENVIWQLEKIANDARTIRTQEITPPLSDEEGVYVLSIDDLIRERIGQLWEMERMAFVGFTPQLELVSQAQVRLSPEWFRRALDLLLYNAVAALEQVEYRELVISTARVNNYVQIELMDTGPGLPPEVQKVAFKHRVERPQGLGIGLLMVQIIIETYGGHVSIQETGPHGTIMAIVLPMV